MEKGEGRDQVCPQLKLLDPPVCVCAQLDIATKMFHCVYESCY